MLEKLLEAINLYLYLHKEKYPEADARSHTALNGFSLYVDGGSYDETLNRLVPDKNDHYATIGFAGITVNLNGEIALRNPEFQNVDYKKWIENVLSLLKTQNWEESRKMTIEDFIVANTETIKTIAVNDIFAEEHRVKAKMFDKLLERNISFNK